MKSSPLLFFVIFVSVITSLKVQAQKKVALDKASWISGLSPLTEGPFPEYKAIRASYDLTWKKSVRAGSATITLSPNKKNPEVIQGVAQGSSSGVAGKLYPYEFTYRSSTRLGSKLRPRSATLKETTRKSKTDNSIKFLADHTACERQVTELKTGVNKDVRCHYTMEKNLAQDAFSLLLGARNLPLTQGQEITSLVVPVDKPYLIRFKVIGRETREVKGTNFKAIKLDLKIIGKVNGDLSIKTYDKVKSCTLWISDDAERLPLELKAEIFVGHMSVIMTNREYIQ